MERIPRSLFNFILPFTLFATGLELDAQTWRRTYGGFGTDEARDVKETLDAIDPGSR